LKQVLLDKNENLFEPSPLCFSVFNEFDVRKFSHYPRKSELFDRLMKKYNVEKDNLIIGYGAEDVLKNLFSLLIKEKDSVCTPKVSWHYYDFLAKNIGAKVHHFDLIEKDFSFEYNVNEIISSVQKNSPKLLVVGSPNNPTGNSMSLDDLEKILSSINPKSIVLFDNVYSDFYEEIDYDRLLSFIKKYENLIILKSISKSYCLAGLRFGYALCSQQVRKLIHYFDYYLGINPLIEEMVIAALSSDRYYKSVAQESRVVRDEFISKVNNLHSFKAFSSNANFVLVKLPVNTSEIIDKALKNNGFIVRFFPNLKNHCRITIGTREQMNEVFEVFSKLDSIL